MKTIVLVLLVLTCTLQSSRGEVIDGIQKTYRVTQVNNNNGSSSAVSYNVALLDFVQNNMTWTAAQNYCRNTAADLVTFYKEEDIWLLLSITKNKEFWIGLHCDSDNWHWSNGDNLTYSNWDRDLFCAFAQSNGSWSDSVCDKNKPFMCYNKTGNINETYFWINEKMSWSRAQNYCRVNYTDLVSIRNESENQEIMKKAKISPFWIGLFNNPWKWSDGGNSTFQNWTSGNPDNNNHAEKCVVNNFQLNVSTCNENDSSCWKNNYEGKGWNDANCTLTKTFFCTDKTNVCTSYYFVSKPMSWDDAQKYCRANNTDLVTVENETVNSELLKISENRSWIGLRHETNHWYWSNGDPVAYTNWTHKFSCAVFQTDGSWNDSDCNQQKPFMCYKDSTNINRTYFWISENMTWSNAQNYCRVNYTDLVSIRNETENEEVRNRSQSAPFWIGLFIGARKWSDGRTPSYQNWQPQEPDNFHHQETCMKVNTNGKLRNEDCKSNYSFFCSQNVINVTFVNKDVTWEEALDYCIKMGSSLISITSQTEQEALAALLQTTNSSTVWLGLRQSRLFGFWFWVDERPLSYENWANGNHLNLSNSHHCATISKTNFTWIDVSCSDSHSFICK
ncbi:macrophage mannose receptor 1-like isoform X2 [Polypterus senegalus]|uniref:macrophage mannose receptor 1-like isoform X2 n=1 Tax=Polypterus senegalus TaxID=55291 RepID=UPI00196353B3|nr:macrophage mannose receptor 1-like isoform X2 [Polypterus senegalus]